ncbi:hypothetical protein LCGC14_2069620, partial [marine sediment metagenome]
LSVKSYPSATYSLIIEIAWPMRIFDGLRKLKFLYLILGILKPFLSERPRVSIMLHWSYY